MKQVLENIEAECVYTEMARRGIKPHQRVRVVFELIDDDHLSIAQTAQEGGGFDWLADEPDFYTPDDLKQRNI